MNMRARTLERRAVTAHRQVHLDIAAEYRQRADYLKNYLGTATGINAIEDELEVEGEILRCEILALENENVKCHDH